MTYSRAELKKSFFDNFPLPFQNYLCMGPNSFANSFRILGFVVGVVSVAYQTNKLYVIVFPWVDEKTDFFFHLIGQLQPIPIFYFLSSPNFIWIGR